MKKTEKRLITLSDGTGMGGELLVIRTDAPAEVLSELEKISCEIFINGANYGRSYMGRCFKREGV